MFANAMQPQSLLHSPEILATQLHFKRML